MSVMICLYFMAPLAKVHYPSQILERLSNPHHLKAACKKLLGLNRP